MYRKIFQVISLYELIPFGVLLLAFSSLNLYLFVFALAILSKHLPEQFIKRVVPVQEKLKARPYDAVDCGMLNDGGIYRNKPGFPSGHTFTAWFVFIYILLAQDSVNGLTFITAIFAILVPYARVALHCHTPTQVFAGALLGCIWAWIFYYFEKNVLTKNERYKNDRERLFRFIG